MGGHLVHLIHWLVEETEHGGPFAVVGIVIGAVIGYAIDPVMQPTELCQTTGAGKDFLGNCPDVFTPEALVVVLGCAAVLGAVGVFIAWSMENGTAS